MSFFNKITGFFKSKNPLESLADVVDRFVETKADKKEFFMEVYKKELEDRDKARGMYSKDNNVQKIYAIVFLLSYLIITGLLLYFISTGDTREVNKFETGLIGTILGGMTAKVNTVTDFFFGSSEKNNK